jgi:hypothetical protein
VAAAEAPARAFAEGEAAEIREQQLDKAADIYRRLGDAKDPAVKAGALLRLARVLRKAGRQDAAVPVYERLSRMEGVRVSGVPADLVARHAVCDLSRDKADAARLQEDLLAGRWLLTRGQFEFYWSEAVRLSGHDVDLSAKSGLAQGATGL